MEKHFRSIVLSLLFIFVVFGCNVAEKNTSANLGLAPALELLDLNDKAVSLSDYKDKKTVVLLFWTSWCQYCMRELRALDKEYPDFVKESIELLLINVGEPKDYVANFMKSRNLNLKVLLDENSYIADKYEVLGVPTYFVINKSGYIVSSGSYLFRGKLKEIAKG